MQARCHYTSAEVDGKIVYNLYDDAHVEVSLFLSFYFDANFIHRTSRVGHMLYNVNKT